MKNLLILGAVFLLLIGLYGLALWNSRKKEKEVFAKPANISQLAVGAEGKTSTNVLPSHDAKAPTSTLTPTFSIPEVTKSAAAKVTALMEAGATSETLEAAKAAVLAKVKADIAVYGGEGKAEAISTFQISKNRAAISLAVDQGITYYSALHALGYPVASYLVGRRSSIDKEIDAIRAGTMTKEEVYARHGY